MQPVHRKVKDKDMTEQEQDIGTRAAERQKFTHPDAEEIINFIKILNDAKNKRGYLVMIELTL
jgi:hypothetical protein